jgi:capsular polysaccharide transport system permease protein
MPDLSRHLNVLRALIVRDLMVRFGRSHLGFAWTILEPMILCTGVMVLWSFTHSPTFHGVPIVGFVLTGYMPLTMWRHMTNPLTRILRSNVNLLYHQPVSHVHILLARSFVEFMSTTAALLVIFFVVRTLGLVGPVEDPGLALAAWLFTAWYFGAMGIAISAWTEYWEVLEKFLAPAQYLQLPLSGVFFMVDWMPNNIQKLLLLNPSVHCFEMFRAGFFGSETTTHYDPVYLAACSTVLTLIAAAATYHVRDRVQMS